MNDINTIDAPIQYVGLVVCEFNMICPTSDSGIERLKPTVTANGDVNNSAYAQQKSEIRDVREFNYGGHQI